MNNDINFNVENNVETSLFVTEEPVAEAKNEYEKYLPVGTVVMLKEGKKRVMITGFCCTGDGKENTNKIFDYTGCLYPEGFISSKKFLLFDHEQIDKIYFVGYKDDEEVKFKEKLVKIVEEMKKNMQNPM